MAPQEQQTVNMLNDVQSVDAISDLSSDPVSEAAYDGGISDNSVCSSPDRMKRYRIPMRKSPESQVFYPVQQGLKASQVHSSIGLLILPKVMRIELHVLSVLDGNHHGCNQTDGYLDSSTPLLPTRNKVMCMNVSWVDSV